MRKNLLISGLFLGVAACSGAIESGDPGAPVVGPNQPPRGTPAPTPDPSRPPPDPDTSLPDATTALTCKGKAASSPARIWRLSASQYENTIRSLAPGLAKETVVNPFSGATSSTHFSNYAKSFGLPGPLLDRTLNASEQVSTRLMQVLATELPCVATADAACARMVIEKVGARAFRRPLLAEELDRFSRFVESLRASAGAQEALRTGLQALMSSPHFLFRLELGDGKVDAQGRRRLTSHELASALSYTLTDGPPDATLMAAANGTGLATPADLRAQVTRLMGDPSENPTVQRFLREYFEYDKAVEVFKDPKAFAYHNAPALVADTEAWLKEIVKGRKDVVKTLLAASWGYVGPKTATNYNLEAMAPKVQQRTMLPAAQRAGILTQPAFLTAFSDSDGNLPIERGKFIASNLLCIGLPATPPDNVPPLPDMPNATMRERLQVHSTSLPSCKGCHDIMDGLGLGLEMYDHTGRYRTMEAGKPADGRGHVVGTNSPIDGPFNGAVELATRLASSTQVEQCFVRQQFRYLLGRDETELDACSLADAYAAFQKGGDLGESLVALLSSDSFLYRSER